MSEEGKQKIREAFENSEKVEPVEGLAPPPEAPAETGGGAGAPPHTPDYDDIDPLGDFVPEMDGAKLPLNDVGNGQRFALYCGKDAKYVPRVGWHIWDGMRWKLDPDGIEVRRLGQSIHERINAEIPFLPLNGGEQRKQMRLEHIREELRGELEADRKTELEEEKAKLNSELWGKGSTRQRHLTFGNSSGNNGKIKCLLEEAITSLHCLVEDLNADPLTVNTETGLLRFSAEVDEHDAAYTPAGQPLPKRASVVILPHEREVSVAGKNRPQYITKVMPVEYDPDATCPKFDAFLERIMPDKEDREFLSRWFGLSMTALPVQKFLYCYGGGANGKSLLANLMRRMLGDYATMVKIQSLIGKDRKSGADATPDLFRLIGARAALTSEPEEGERLQEQKVKELTGGDEMLVRTLHSDFVEFTPYFKLTFTGNHKLDIRGTDDGIWRRPLLMPFDVQIPAHERDETLGDQLFDEERSGILNWMIAGLKDYLEGGLQEPEKVVQATEEYRKESDPIGDFLATGCAMDDSSDFLLSKDLTAACYLYLLENTSHGWQMGRLQRKLKGRADKYLHPKTKRGFSAHKRNGQQGFTGIRLTDEMRQRLDDAPRDQKGVPMLRNDDGGGGSSSGGGDYPL